MYGQLDQPENRADLQNLYHQKGYLTKETTKPTSRLPTPVNYTLMTRVSFQLSQERATNTSWWHTTVMPMQSWRCPSSHEQTRTTCSPITPSCSASRIEICSHHFIPSSSINNGSEIFQTVIASLRTRQKIIC